MDLIFQAKRQAVAQKIEPDFVGGGVGDIAGVGRAALRGGHALLNVADRQAEEAIDLAHPGCVAAGEVVVHGHDVDAVPLTREPGDGRNGRQRLAFAGLHFGDAAARQRQRPAQLDVEHIQSQHAGCDGRCNGHHGE